MITLNSKRKNLILKTCFPIHLYKNMFILLNKWNICCKKMWFPNAFYSNAFVLILFCCVLYFTILSSAIKNCVASYLFTWANTRILCLIECFIYWKIWSFLASFSKSLKKKQTHWCSHWEQMEKEQHLWRNVHRYNTWGWTKCVLKIKDIDYSFSAIRNSFPHSFSLSHRPLLIY